jgi:hypothetical protein
MSMTFLELQQEMSTVPGARFKSTQSSSYKHWINSRAAELWNMEDWTFRKNKTTMTVTAGQESPTEPADLGVVLGLWNQYGDPVTYRAPGEFFTDHQANVYNGSTSSAPDYFTVVNKMIYLDPTPSVTSSSWVIHYDRAYCHVDNGGNYVAGDMTADTDRPALPDECHYLLVHGATAMGSINMNDFTYQFAEQGWQNGIEAMRRNYLADQRTGAQQWGGAYPIFF